MLTKKQFEKLFDEYVNDVSAFLQSYASSRNQLEDLVQEVFIKIWDARDKIDVKHPAVKSYLLKTARNVTLKKLRSENRYRQWLEENMELLTHDSPEEKSFKRPVDFKSAYQAAVSKIPPGARKVYLLSRENGLTYNEIASLLDISPKTVEAHIGRALRVLREELKGYRDIGE